MGCCGLLALTNADIRLAAAAVPETGHVHSLGRLTLARYMRFAMHDVMFVRADTSP